MPVAAAETTTLSGVTGVAAGESGNIVNITFNDGLKGRITFLEDGIFRYNVDPSGEFSEYARPRSSSHVARIQAFPDDDDTHYTLPDATISETDGEYTITAGTTSIIFDKATAKMTVKKGDKVVMSEKEALTVDSTSYQTLNASEGEDFYGGGTQNGRFVHTGKTISISNTNNWTDGGVASPNPFYWSSNGYGVMRNTFSAGSYEFGSTEEGTVKASHGENEFDAYYFVTDETQNSKIAQDILRDYFQVTGNPVLLPEYGFYLGHLNCYNRDSWSNESGSKRWTIKNGEPATDGNYENRYESGMASGYVIPSTASAETLNGTRPTVNAQNFTAKDTPEEFSARAVIDRYYDNDMPFGWFLPNDGYGCGYGQNGYYVDGGTAEERAAAVQANAENLGKFTEYAHSKGVATGLWTQSNLTPIASEKQHLQRDFEKEVTVGGISTLKTDVAWVGSGYSFGLNGVKQAYDIATTKGDVRPNIVTLDGWAGTQRYGSIWSGDQYGGNWEYIRFHIPTFVGQAMSGNPNAGSDMDGIFGGAPIIATRDYQWKTFISTMLDMDGWGSYVKSPYTHGDPYTGISRMYLKLKAQLMPYIYTSAASAANIDTGNDDTGLPYTRAMMLVDDSDYAASVNTQYQYMFGDAFLVAPVYQDTNMDENGNDVRNDIFLPGDADDIWIDYFNGKQYRGGQVINNFDAPLWKLPLFVRNGSIIPMYEENNNPEAISETNPNGLDKTKRIVEFYPAGTTDYTLYEDDGKTINNTLENDADYGKISHVDYGTHVSTHFTSVVDEAAGTATLTAEASTGTYEGYDSNRNTQFTVNVSKEPTSVEANGTELTKAASLEAFNALGENESGWFYDAAPEMNKYAGDEGFGETHIINSPKVYVKFAKTDVNANAQTAVIHGFENKGDLIPNVELDTIGVPAPAAVEDALTPTSITISWPAVEGAIGYEVLADGVINATGAATTYTQSNLEFHSDHKYQVRALTSEGHGKWSSELTVTTLLDPWRNVPYPEDIDWEGGIYSNRYASKAFDHEFQGGDGGFHSDGNSIGQALTLDYGKIYKWDKLEYYPRDDRGNGTVTKMDISYSMDGTNWTDLPTQEWVRSADMKEVTLNCAARYIRMIPRESVGNFFSASEIAIYKADGTNGWALGSNLMRDTVTDADYSNMKNYLALENKAPDTETYQAQIADHFADLNNNGVYDVYDYSFTMAALDGGTKQTGAIKGGLFWSANAGTVNAGDEVTVTLYGSNVANANAIGGLFRFSLDEFEFVDVPGTSGVTKSGYLAMMEDLSRAKTTFADGTGTVNVAFANRGNQMLYSGSGALASFTLRAKKDGVKVNEEQMTMLVGPKGDSIQKTTSHDVEIPETPAYAPVKLTLSELTPTMTNENYPTDDGSNITKMTHQKTWEGLFDGAYGRDLEFPWYNIDPGYDLACMPVDITFTLKTPEKSNGGKLTTGALTSNGDIKSHTATATFTDGTTQEWDYNNVNKEVYEYNISEENQDKLLEKLVLHITETDGAQPNYNLTLSEMEIFALRGVPITGLTVTDLPSKVYTGDLISVEASVQPAETNNPYVRVTSSNPEVLDVIAINSGDAIDWYLKGLKAGTATITVTAAGDESFTKSFDIEVSDEIDVSDLVAAISKAKSIPEDLLTAASYQTLSEKVAEAEALLAGEYTRAQIMTEAYELNQVIGTLKYRDPIMDQLIDNSTVSIEDFSSDCADFEDAPASAALDGDTDTYWHSNYINSIGMPQYLTFDLGASYKLTDVSFLPRISGYNGDIFTAEILLGSDPDNLTSVGTWDFERGDNGYQLKDRESWHTMTFAPQSARYVKFNVLHSGGDKGNDRFCSLSEVRFFGVKDAVQHTANKTLLNRAIAYAQEQKNDPNYSKINEIVKNKFEAALDAAVKVAEDKTATQEEVNTAWKNLSDMIHLLGFTADKAPLADLVAAAQEIADHIDQYEGDIEGFQTAFEEAKAVLESETALDESIQAAITKLQGAIDGLTKKVVVLNKEVLQFVVDKSTEAEGKLTAYVEAGQAEFIEALNHARDVLANAETQDEIDNAASALNTAYMNLRLKADESILKELQAFLAEASNIDESKYSADELSFIKEVTAKVRKSLDDHYNGIHELTADEAEELSSLSAEALNVIRQGGSLQNPNLNNVKPGDTNGNGNGTSNNVKPGADNNGTAGNTTGNSIKSTVTNSVKTSAASYAGGFAAMFAAAGAALLALKKRRNKK